MSPYALFDPNTAKPLTMETRVVRAGPREVIGVKFQTLAESDKKAIWHCIAVRIQAD